MIKKYSFNTFNEYLLLWELDIKGYTTLKILAPLYLYFRYDRHTVNKSAVKGCEYFDGDQS